MSMHAYGAAIDLQSSVGNYWRWSGRLPTSRGRDVVPRELIDLFERHGFIWSGNWFHIDSIHFEYHPELIESSKRWRSFLVRYLEENPM